MKTQKNLLVALFLACCPLFLFGQLKHEVKIVPLDLFSTFTPSYELILNEKIGVEIEMSFDSREPTFFGSSLGGNFSSETFERKRFIPSVSGRYYFSNNKYGSGFYIGPHFKSIFNTFIEEAFEERYFQIHNTAPPSWGRKGFQSFGIGLNGGFKWLIKEHFIVASSFFWDIFYTKDENEKFEARGSDLDMEIRVGYRF